MTTADGTQIHVLDEHDLTELPRAGHLTTVLVEIPPQDPGTPPHRHSGPVYGYMLEGEMIFELEGDPPRIVSSSSASTTVSIGSPGLQAITVDSRAVNETGTDASPP